ncbi:hypothetical protein pb186bvf_018866 [Paramecium bursaria]
MSRHTAVKRMIQKGSYIDSEEEEEQEVEDYDKYADENFSDDELICIVILVEEFDGIYNKKQIIDALYETDGNSDAARNLLLQRKQKLIKQESKVLSKPPPLIKQQSSEPKKAYHLEYNVDKFNQPYPPIKYKIQPQFNTINIIIAGHVDTGKSTLLGQILHQLKIVDEREVRKHHKEAQSIGKESFSYAFLTDSTNQEKQRGITMDVSYKVIQINDKLFNLMDSPGHMDYMPHMITGATQADYAMIVVDVCQNAFDNSLKKNTVQEYIYLMKSLGIPLLLFCINKMDLIKWDQVQYNKITSALEQICGTAGFLKNQLLFIPISAFQSQNVTKQHQCPWYKGLTLLDSLSNLEHPRRHNDRPLRMLITNKFQQNEGKLRGTIIFGKIESGQIEKGQTYVIIPHGIVCKVKEINDGKTNYAAEGSIAEISIQCAQEQEFNEIKTGYILCNSDIPIPCSNLFVCEISTLDLECPFIKGTQFIIHINGQKVPVQVKKMNSVYKDAEKQIILRKFPRAICGLEYAEIELETETAICAEISTNIKSLSQFILRDKLRTVALGKIVEIKINKNKLKEGKILHEQQI